MDTVESINARVAWISKILADSGAKGVVYGNSGGKDCTLVAALCKMATDNVLGVLMPCQSAQNYGSDTSDANAAAASYGIPQITVDLTAVKEGVLTALGTDFATNCICENAHKMACANINPRLRMLVLYAIAQTRGYLVAGTGNLDEITMGYFTKWGDGAYDFNPIADLNVEEVYAHLRALNAPENIVEKVPSAGLYQGQTDEAELGISYREIDKYLRGEEVSDASKTKIETAKARNAHKLRMPLKFGG